MKTSMCFRISVFLALLVASFSCDDREEVISEKSGRLTLSFERRDDPQGRTSDWAKPSSVFLAIENSQGEMVIEDKKLALLEFGESYVTEGISLNAGSYKLISFLVLDEQNKVLYAAPLEGSDKAQYVEQALPISFTVAPDVTVEVKPQVLEVTSSDAPESFGYASFGFEVVDGGQTMRIKIQLQLKVGDITYMDVDTKITVSGYNSDNVQQYREEFAFVGPYDNEFAVKSGYHRYTFEVNHFGIYDKQTMLGKHLWENSRGPVVCTYVMGGSIAAKKLASSITYTEHPDGGNKIMVPESKIEYTYNGEGKLDRMTHFTFSESTGQFRQDRYFTFTYANGRVEKIHGFLPGENTPYSEDFYSYQNDGNVSRIAEKNTHIGMDWELNLTYQYTDRLVTASYINSEGNGFQYEATAHWKTITRDKTTRGNQLCSEGTYTHDKKINPLKHLGYMDFLFRNYSVSNRTTEQINYTGCSFPSLVPESYEYEYDAQGYPTVAITNYKSGTFRMQTSYLYQN